MELQKSPWDLIDEAATEEGVKEGAIRKWKDRGRVPPRWHIILIQRFAAKGILVGLDFFNILTPPEKPERRPAGKPDHESGSVV